MWLTLCSAVLFGGAIATAAADGLEQIPFLPRSGWGDDAVVAIKPGAAGLECPVDFSVLAAELQAHLDREAGAQLVVLSPAAAGSDDDGDALAWPASASAVVYAGSGGYAPYTYPLACPHTQNASEAAAPLARFASLAQAVGDPRDVVHPASPRDLEALVDRSDPPMPVFTLFCAPDAAQCARVAPAFAAAASMYRGQIHFAEVACAGQGSSEILRRFCQRRNVTAFPTLGLYTGEFWVPFDQAGTARSAGDFERFFVRHRDRLPHAGRASPPALQPALLHACPAADASTGTHAPVAMTAAGSGVAKSGGLSAACDCDEKVGRLLQKLQALERRLLELEQWRDVQDMRR